MAGSPRKREKNRLVREAILREAEGKDPLEVLAPFVKKLKARAMQGDVPALREIFDRVDGKAVQQVVNEGVQNVPLVDMALLGAAGELWKRIKGPVEKVVLEDKSDG